MNPLRWAAARISRWADEGIDGVVQQALATVGDPHQTPERDPSPAPGHTPGGGRASPPPAGSDPGHQYPLPPPPGPPHHTMTIRMFDCGCIYYWHRSKIPTCADICAGHRVIDWDAELKGLTS